MPGYPSVCKAPALITCLQKSWVTGQNFTTFYQTLRVTGGVNARIQVAIPIRCRMPANRIKAGYADFRRLAPKIVYYYIL